MKHEGVVDRIEEGKATILVETIGKEFTIDNSSLPGDVEEGTWLLVEIDGGKLTVLEVNKEKTEARRSQITEQLSRIRKRSQGSKFQRRK